MFCGGLNLPFNLLIMYRCSLCYHRSHWHRDLPVTLWRAVGLFVWKTARTFAKTFSIMWISIYSDENKEQKKMARNALKIRRKGCDDCDMYSHMHSKILERPLQVQEIVWVPKQTLQKGLLSMKPSRLHTYSPSCTCFVQSSIIWCYYLLFKGCNIWW